MNKQVLFLTLRIFSATGGIEKVCKVVCKAIDEIRKEQAGVGLKVFSMYDATREADDKYISPVLFSGFGTNKIKFVYASILNGLKSDVILLSHINLLSIGFVIKCIFPKKKLLLFAHGIEVWKPLSAVRKKMLGKCDSILAVSQFTKTKLQEQCHLPDKNIIVLNNCIDPYLPPSSSNTKSELLMKQYGFKKDDIVLMTLTRLSSKELYKGYDNVLLSIRDLKKSYPNIKYLIVGRYDEQEKQRLDSIISKYSLEQYVTFAGYIPDELIADHYQLADVYVMPSKKEGFGIVFIEAMFYGLPVIAGNKDGSVDALDNGRLGILVDPDEQVEINDAIEKILHDKDHYKPEKVLLSEKFGYPNYKKKLSSIILNFN